MGPTHRVSSSAKELGKESSKPVPLLDQLKDHSLFDCMRLTHLASNHLHPIEPRRFLSTSLAGSVKQAIHPSNLIPQLHNLLTYNFNPLLALQAIITNIMKEDTDSVGRTRVGDAAIGEPPTTKMPMPSASAGATPSGSGTIFESDSGSLGFSSIDALSSIPYATGPFTDSPSERSIAEIGSLSGTISLREYDDDAVPLGPSTTVPSWFKQLNLIAYLGSNDSNLSNRDALIPPVLPAIPSLGVRTQLESLSESRHIKAAFTPEFKRAYNCNSRALRTKFGSHNKVCPETNLSFKPLMTLHKAAVPPQSMIRCLM
ncbi:hypothetical protein M9H77_26774 [Catharanthus roseus]|uniref:Uncharacterized protein n=1 Tax=Catharanthus roseus TaxID=4058 RepID=A0ACC0ABM0_CATRO|nr:hypothetical protein M9H77_26774 [Catharanthus roseus]